MRIAIGSDHAGYNLKKVVVEYFEKKNIEFRDFGTLEYNSCDYPDFALAVAEVVAAGEYNFGILVCGTGIGISIAANKVPGIRAALCCDTFSARSSREHNNANILALGERVVGTGLALDIVEAFLSASFLGERHETRVNKITQIEKKYNK